MTILNKNKDIKSILTKKLENRESKTNKSHFGKTLIFAGSENYPGAQSLAIKSALKSGTGYVASAILPTIPLYFSNDEVIIETIKDIKNISDVINKYSVILFGNGLENNKYNAELLTSVINNHESYLVIDATGLDILKTIGLNILKQPRKNRIILMPHIGEFERLFDLDVSDSDVNSYKNLVEKYSDEYGISIILKSYNIIVRSHQKTTLIRGEESTLAKAGSGDMFAGLFSGFLSYFDLPIDIVTKSAYFCIIGTCEYLLKSRIKGMISINDIIETMPIALKKKI